METDGDGGRYPTYKKYPPRSENVPAPGTYCPGEIALERRDPPKRGAADTLPDGGGSPSWNFFTLR